MPSPSSPVLPLQRMQPCRPCASAPESSFVLLDRDMSLDDLSILTMQMLRKSRIVLVGSGTINKFTHIHAFPALHSFNEVNFANIRFLQEASFGKDSGMSLPLPGMSLPYPGMSLPYPGMSLPYSGMSIPYPGMSLPFQGMLPSFKTLAPTTELSLSPSSTPTTTMPRAKEQPTAPSALNDGNKCTPRDMTAKATITLRLDIDSLSNDSTFLENLAGMADEIVSYGELHFSLCHQPAGIRMLSEHQSRQLPGDQTEVAVTGLEASASPVGNFGGKFLCQPS